MPTCVSRLRAALVVVLNFTPVPRPGYRIGVPHAGDWIEQLNSDSAHYGGSNLGNLSRVPAEPVSAQGCPCSALITLPPLAAVILLPEPAAALPGDRYNQRIRPSSYGWLRSA